MTTFPGPARRMWFWAGLAMTRLWAGWAGTPCGAAAIAFAVLGNKPAFDFHDVLVT